MTNKTIKLFLLLFTFVFLGVLPESSKAQIIGGTVKEELQEDYSNSNLSLLPTARVGESASAYIKDANLAFPSLYVRLPVIPLEVNAGSSVMPLTWQEFYAGAKLQLINSQIGSDGERFSVAGGAAGMVSSNYVFDDGDAQWGRVFYGASTIDLDADMNESGQRVGGTSVTLGGGYLQSGVVEDGAMIFGGFEHRQSGNFKFLLDGVYLPASNDVLGGPGFRYMQGRTTFGLAAITGSPLYDIDVPVIPVVNFSVKLF